LVSRAGTPLTRPEAGDWNNRAPPLTMISRKSNDALGGKMSGRLGFLIGLGAGYVLGAKAGTERYEQLRRLYDNLVASPAFREASGKAKGAVGSGLDQARGAASEGASKVTSAIRERRGDSSLQVAPPPT
jgi:uncharacterized protein YgiB involved in biofilm formation